MPLLLLVAGLAAAAGPPGTLVRYEVVEATRATTPAGPRETALAGTVSAAFGKARWDLSASRLPGVAARSALADAGALVLLDPESKSAAYVTREEFAGLFQAPAGPEGMAAADLRDLRATVAREGSGTPFEGMATIRWAVSCSFTLVSALPGRVVRVKHELSGTIDAVDELAFARTPFDDLLRLFRVRGAAREALAAGLSSVTGLPVRVRLDAASEATGEAVGAGDAPALQPLKSSTTTTRTLSALVRRPAADADAPLFTVPDSYRSIPLERLRTGGSPLP